jgi:hypothetical protein
LEVKHVKGILRQVQEKSRHKERAERETQERQAREEGYLLKLRDESFQDRRLGLPFFSILGKK